MDEKLRQVIENKINETLSKSREISEIFGSIEDLSVEKQSFIFGIVVGRLYNSFYYQCRRIFNRNPTPQEFSEFLEIIQKKKTELMEKLE